MLHVKSQTISKSKQLHDNAGPAVKLWRRVSLNHVIYGWIGLSSGGSSYIYLRDYTTGTNELLYDYELKTMLDPINSLKQVVFVHAPHSEGFTGKLNDKIIETASFALEGIL